MIKGAWIKVPAATIQSCWKKGDFTDDESTDVIIFLPPPPVGQSEEELMMMFKLQIHTEEEITKELVSVIQSNNGIVVEVSDNDDDNDKPEEATPSAAEMQEYLHQLASGLDRAEFRRWTRLVPMNAEVDDHLRKTFPPSQTLLHRFFIH